MYIGGGYSPIFKGKDQYHHITHIQIFHNFLICTSKIFKLINMLDIAFKSLRIGAESIVISNHNSIKNWPFSRGSLEVRLLFCLFTVVCPLTRELFKNYSPPPRSPKCLYKVLERGGACFSLRSLCARVLFYIVYILLIKKASN